MRLFASFAAVALCAVACGPPPGPSPSPSTAQPTSSVRVNPANIERVRGDLPDGYEVDALSHRAAPAALWGFGADWTADPPPCGVLANPVSEPVTTRGWSGSGPGGIVYAVVAASPQPVTFDPALTAECGHWTLSGGRTSGSVTFVAAPAVDDATTVGVATESTTVVEGGTETRSHASTFTAYLGDHVAFVTVVTDPGSPNPPLGQDFAAALLVKTVSALRG